VIVVAVMYAIVINIVKEIMMLLSAWFLFLVVAEFAIADFLHLF